MSKTFSTAPITRLGGEGLGRKYFPSRTDVQTHLKWLVSSTSGYVRPCNLKPQRQNNPARGRCSYSEMGALRSMVCPEEQEVAHSRGPLCRKVLGGLRIYPQSPRAHRLGDIPEVLWPHIFKRASSFPRICRCASSEMQMPPRGAIPSSRAAMFTRRPLIAFPFVPQPRKTPYLTALRLSKSSQQPRLGRPFRQQPNRHDLLASFLGYFLGFGGA